MLPANVEATANAASVTDEHRSIARLSCSSGERRAIWLGALALRHPAFADLRQLAAALAELSGAKLGYLAEGSTPPVRIWAERFRIGTQAVAGSGSCRPQCAPDAGEPLKGYVLLGGIDIDKDLGVERAAQALARCGMRDRADALHERSGRQQRDHPAAHRDVCGDLRHLRQPRGRWQSFARRREAGR